MNGCRSVQVENQREITANCGFRKKGEKIEPFWHAMVGNFLSRHMIGSVIADFLSAKILFTLFFCSYSYLRSISYREFCRLVYGFMGNKQIPLLECPYTAIRKQFPITNDEPFT